MLVFTTFCFWSTGSLNWGVFINHWTSVIPLKVMNCVPSSAMLLLVIHKL